MATKCNTTGKIGPDTFSYPICCIILLIIFIISIKQSSPQKINTYIKSIYLIAIVAAITSNLLTIIVYITQFLCISLSQEELFTYLLSIGVIAYVIMIMCVLLTLLLRLYFTFQGSIFAISKYQTLFFIISFICFCIAYIMTAVGFALNIGLFLNAVYVVIILYLVLNIYPMILFVLKMYELIKMRASSSNETFNEQQKQLLYTTTKYVTLLLIAMISTWITVWVVLMEASLSGRTFVGSGISANIDCVINILCLYWQYPFNNKYYDKYCGCFGTCCIYLLATSQRKKSGQKSTMTIQEAVSTSADTSSQDHLSQQTMKLTFNLIPSNSANPVKTTPMEIAEVKSSQNGNHVQRNHDDDESFLNRTMDEVLRQESENTRNRDDESMSEVP